MVLKENYQPSLPVNQTQRKIIDKRDELDFWSEGIPFKYLYKKIKTSVIRTLKTVILNGRKAVFHIAYFSWYQLAEIVSDIPKII